MQSVELDQLLDDIKHALAENLSNTFAIIGHTTLTYDILAFMERHRVERRLCGVYAELGSSSRTDHSVKPLRDLVGDKPTHAILAADAEKEDLLASVLAYLTPQTKILLGGHGHFGFRDAIFDATIRNSLVPSLANGYPHTLVHLYQCLQNSARLGLQGVVAEFGMYKGGTTMLLSQLIEKLGCNWKVIGFDTFSGFPPRRSVLDMYAHPDCVFSDEDAVRKQFVGREVEIVSGDVGVTARRLEDENVVLAFIDTDNYTSATAVLDVIQDRVLVGGAIVFDHFTGRNRFRYTLGERIAATRLLSDNRYFNLHDTGVFFRQR